MTGRRPNAAANPTFTPHCLATGPVGLSCVLDDGHPPAGHISPSGAVWQGGPDEQRVQVSIVVGHLKPFTVGDVPVRHGVPTAGAVADLLEAVAAEMRAVLARQTREDR